MAADRSDAWHETDDWSPVRTGSVVPLLGAAILFVSCLFLLASAEFTIWEVAHAYTPDRVTAHVSHDLPTSTTRLATVLAIGGLATSLGGLALARARVAALVVTLALASTLAGVTIHAWATLDTTAKAIAPSAYECAVCETDAKPGARLAFGTFSATAGAILLAGALAFEPRRPRVPATRSAPGRGRGGR